MSGTVDVAAGRIFRITLNRPDSRNALDTAMLAGFRSALDSASRNAEARCILLDGQGKHFCAGADFADVAAGAEEGVRYGGVFEELLRAIEEHPLPVVAKVHGAALGAGCQIVAASDLAVAAGDARIGVPSARLGLLLDLEKIERMIRVWGVQTVREMLLAAKEFDGSLALERRMVVASVPPAALEDHALALCEQVASRAPLSVRGSKAGIRAILDKGPLRRDVDVDVFAAHDTRAVEALQSADLKEGLSALRERRSPDFTGR